MTDGTLETVLRRDRLIVASALGVIVALAWAYVIWLAADMDMDGMNMSEFRMIPAGFGMMAPAAAPWSAIEFAFVFVMWAVMMIGMMAPSAAPMILMYARVARQSKIAGKPLAATGWFAAGYFLAWTGFSLAATLVQWVLEREALLDARMASANILLGAVVLIAAGLYQWTPIKNACLSQCQTPLSFLMRHGGFRSDVLGCLRLGLVHGIYCVGCCWILMALLFVVGVMNVLWIALLALVVLLEKLTPLGRSVARIAGVVCIGAGAWMISATANAQYTSRGPEVRATAPSIPANAKDIVLKGEQVCLRRLPDASGRVLLDCAIGLRGDDDRFYGLRAADPTRAHGFPEMNVRVRVTGKLISNSSGEFVEAGQIVYASIEPIANEPKPVTGTFMCLAARPAGAPPIDKCRSVVKTDRGLHWGLDMRSIDAIPKLAPGDRISLEADILREVPEEWHPWMFPSDTERLEGVLEVRSLQTD